MRTILTEERAAALASPALGHAAQSALLGHSERPGCAPCCWTLARLLRRFPVAPPAGEIRALFDRRLAPDAVAGDLAALRVAPPGVGRLPAGAWILKLAAELRGLDERWGAALAPLADAVRDRFIAVLPRAAEPVRAGTGANSAFALTLSRDYALATADDELLGLLWEKAVDWYGRDRGVRDPEPGAEDVLSPALAEAECMRRLLPAGQWRPWLDASLPELAEGRPAALFRPAEARNGADGPAARRDGLNLGRAWCWRGLASGLPGGDPRRAPMEEAAERHLDAALGRAVGDGTGDDMGEHWLASFALLALEA